MDRKFSTRVSFQRELSRNEHFELWSEALKCIKNVTISGPMPIRINTNWEIDFSESGLSEQEAKAQFTNFMDKQQDIIEDYCFHKFGKAEMAF